MLRHTPAASELLLPMVLATPASTCGALERLHRWRGVAPAAPAAPASCTVHAAASVREQLRMPLPVAVLQLRPAVVL